MNHIKGSIYGFLIGNALAARCRGKNPTHSTISQQLARRYTDPGAMVLTTMDSIVESGRIDFEDIAYRINEWYIGGFMSSGERINGRMTVSQSLRMYGNGMPHDRCGSRDSEVDNSALIRMLPIALWNANEPIETIVDDAHMASRFTNIQIESCVYSALYCLIVRSFLLGINQKASTILEEHYKNRNMDQHVTALKELTKSPDRTQGTSEVRDSFWSTMKIFSKYRSDFEYAITEAICLGEDTEATASLVGSLSGLSIGIDEILPRWLQHLELPDEARTVINRFILMTNNNLN